MKTRIFRSLALAPLTASVFLLAPPASASTADFGRTPPAKPPGHEYRGGGRVAGDTIADAVTIPALPFTDSGSTCGFANDYDEVCPYPGSTSPDVVYRYVASSTDLVTIDLCASAYDTKVYVRRGDAQELIACNDDAACGYSGYQSRILAVSLEAGQIYYVIVDGYGGACGDYDLSIDPAGACEVVCPAGAQIEGEPPCGNGYYDEYNPGCAGGSGYLDGWQPILGGPDGCATMCGVSCTYLFQGLSYRDTDWYRVAGSGGTMTFTLTAEFPVVGSILYGATCADLQSVVGEAAPCEPLTLEWNTIPNHDVWLWVGASVFNGVPPSDYRIDVCGIEPVPSLEGACCLTTGCALLNSLFCDAYNGVWGGPGVPCNPSPCGHTGACCHSDGSCTLVPMDVCNDTGGDWLFPIASCDPDPCGPVPVEETSWGRIKRSFR